MKYLKHKRIPATLLTIPKRPFPKELIVKDILLGANVPLQNGPVVHGTLSKHDLESFADLATSIWRARQRLIGVLEKGPLAAESKRILRPIESALENLEDIGIKIEDYTGQPFVQGMALNVISSQPNSALASDRILETLKPTVLFRGQFVQVGDVIVEGPPSSSSPSL